ncbi:hypothetical protein ACFL6I_26645 [candidate division KSB1 bacterium]
MVKIKCKRPHNKHRKSRREFMIETLEKDELLFRYEWFKWLESRVEFMERKAEFLVDKRGFITSSIMNFEKPIIKELRSYGVEAVVLVGKETKEVLDAALKNVLEIKYMTLTNFKYYEADVTLLQMMVFEPA